MKKHNLSTEELEQLLEQRRAEERAEREKKQAEYEEKRHHLVTNLCARAETLSVQLTHLKQDTIQALEQFREDAKAYGDIRSNSRGGFSLRNNTGELKISYDRNTLSEYDERADLAEDQLRDFLGDMVKKRDARAYEVITGLLERGKAGDFNPAAIAALLKMEDKYDDKRWKKAMRLFKESYNTRLISMNVSFYKKDNMEKDRLIPLNLSSIAAHTENSNNENT